MTQSEALRCLLETLMVAPQRIPATTDGQIGLYRSLLAGRRMLILLDNARDTAQVRPLLPGAPGCLVLVTSRNQLSGLVATEGAYPITLGLFSGGKAAGLLGHRIGHDRVAAEPKAVGDIVASCARLPLALAIVSAHAATNPTVTLSAIASELGDTHRRLAALRGDDPATDVRAVFSWSYRALTPAAARLFRRLGLHPGPDVSTAAAASLDSVPVEVVKSTLAELVRAHLVSETSPGRFALHDLLRAYAAERSLEDPDSLAASRRMCDHYTHSACAAQHVLNTLGEAIPLDPPANGAVVSRFADLAEAHAWFAAEHSVLLTLIGKPMSGFDRHVCRLAWAFAIYLDRRGHWHDWTIVGEVALGAAQRLKDLAAQAHAHRHLARAYTRLDRLDAAGAHLRQALALNREQGDLTAQAHVHLLLSDIAASQGGYAEALVHTRDALDMYVAAGNLRGQADALNSIGWYHAMLGDYDRTVTYCRRALILHRSLGPGIVEATAWDSLGYAYHHLGDHAGAVGCYRRAIDLFQALGDRYFESETLTRLGDTYRESGKHDAAQSVWRQALTILEDLEHPDADGVRSRLAVLTVP